MRSERVLVRLRSARGLSLVEMLIVLGIIGIVSAVIIPFAINGGWFTSSKAAFAAREYFTLLKATSVYASTYNVDTALAYGGRTVVDSETGERVPVVDNLVLARRLKREEIIELRDAGHDGQLTSVDADYYAVVFGPEGVFRPLPNETCLLPDVFELELDQNGDPINVSKTGLRGIRLYDVEGQIFIEPRFDQGVSLDYALDQLPESFPAHIFKPDGSLRVDTTRQRFRVRAGVLPDQPYSDRFHTSEEFLPDERSIPTVFNLFDTDGTTPLIVGVDTFYSTDPDDAPNTFADIDAEIEFFVVTGRVKVIP